MDKKATTYMNDFFVSIGPTRRLEIARIMVDELRFNEETCSNYDIEISSKLRSILEIYTTREGDSEAKRMIIQSLDGFKNLSSDNQKKIIDLVVPYFSKIFDCVVKADIVLRCSQHGHDYNENSWKEYQWETLSTECIDHQIVYNYPTQHIEWSRKCPACGFEEKSLTMPQEFMKTRKKLEKNEKIKKLQAQIDKII